MKIYCGDKSWTRDCRPRWALEELGITDYERIQLDIFGGEGRKSEYLALNPLGKVPFLQDGEVGIFESGAILLYLADKYGIPQLAPELIDPARGEYLQWIVYIISTLDGTAAKLFANTYLFPDRPGAEERRQAQTKSFTKAVALFEDRLKDRDHILGDRFSAADIMLASTLMWADKGGGLEGHPVLLSYLERMRARPAFERTYAATAREFEGYPGKK